LAWLSRVVFSSIGQKALLGVTGLALCLFLVAHLGGNLLLYVGAAEYNHYAHSLHAQKLLLLTAEIGLALTFAVHLGLAFRTASENAAARPQPYAMRQSKLPDQVMARPASSVMMISGVIVFAFLVLHLSDFKFDLRNRGPESEEPFDKAIRVMTDPVTFVGYILGSLVLGYHVLHGFQSAFQSLGLSHPRYTAAIKQLSLVFAIVVGAGFASFPLWVWSGLAKPAGSSATVPASSGESAARPPAVTQVGVSPPIASATEASAHE
jgi:succinate dehydrogenase / fumarate reductase cytochrome b subunit